MKHAELVVRAERWLRNSAWTTPQHPSSEHHTMEARHCSVVLTEPVGVSERPDAIGWCAHADVSLLIECKVTLSDFVADQKKHCRDAWYAMGMYRFYMTPVGLVKLGELPEGWGLLEVEGRRVNVAKQSGLFEPHQPYEKHLLWSECRKNQIAKKKALESQ